MSIPVTFFSNRKRREGHTYEFSLEADQQPYRIVLHAWQRLASSQVRDRASATSCEQVLRELGEELEKSGGGVLVAVGDSEKRRLVHIELVVADAERPENFGALRPGFTLTFEAIGAKKYEFPLGTHLIVPVDGEAGKRLEELQAILGWLPPDIQTLFLHTLRRPSLDTRVDAIERKLFGKTTDAQLSTQGLPWRKRLPAWYRRSVPFWPTAAAVLALLLALNSLQLLVLLEHIESPSIIAPSMVKTSGAPKGRPPLKARNEISLVLQAVANKRGSNDNLNALYRGHFVDFGGKSERELDAVLEKKDAASKKLVQGLLKLEALHLGSQDQPAYLSEYNNVTDMKATFRRLGEKPRTGDSQKLLAALACRVYSIPGLPETHEGSDPAFSFIPGKLCPDVPPTKNGLEELLRFVERL